MTPNRPESVEHPIEMISAYMDGRLEAADRTLVHEHLRDCAACQAILADFRALAAAARREEPPPIPAYLLEKIGRRIDAESEATPASRFPFLHWARLPLATAAAVLVLASLWVVWRGRIPGERLAELRSDAAPPASGGSTEQAQPSQPEPAPHLDAPTKADEPTPFAPSPPVPVPSTVGRAQVKKEDMAQAQATGDREENKMSAAPKREAIPAPEENQARAAAAAEGSMDDARAEGPAPTASAGRPAPVAALGGMAKAAETAGTTLVFLLSEGRVSVLPGSRVVLTSGDYICTLPAGGQEETKELAELRALAARQKVAMPRELVIPAPPEDGPLPPDVAAEMHRRLRAQMRQSILVRAEAECGPLPPDLQQLR